MGSRRGFGVLMLVVGLAAPLSVARVGTPAGGREWPPSRQGDPTRPVPKLADGTVDLSGVWRDGGDANLPRQLKPGELDSLMLPWAKAKMASRKETENPYFYCMPGGPLRLTGSFAWRFVQHPTVNATHIFQIQEGNSHSYRQIFMDGRKHPEDPSPTWYGHSIGRWAGPTLVVDTIGLNDKFWIDRPGTPHTEQTAPGRALDAQHVYHARPRRHDRRSRSVQQTVRCVVSGEPGRRRAARSWSTSASRTISTACREE